MSYKTISAWKLNGEQLVFTMLSGLFFGLKKKREEQRHLLEFKTGDNEAFGIVYRKFQKPVLRFVLARVNDKHIAEDVTQEIFLRAYRFRDTYDEKLKFSSWLWAIARNALVDWFRQNGTGRVSIDPAATPIHPEEIPSSGPDPEKALMARMDKNKLMRMMSNLADSHKEVLMMRLIHQLSYDEMARRLNLSLSAVKCLVYRAKNSLIKTLAKSGIEDSGLALSGPGF